MCQAKPSNGLPPGTTTQKFPLQFAARARIYRVFCLSDSNLKGNFKMADKGKRRSVARAHINGDGAVTFKFANGDEIALNVSELPDTTRVNLECVGVSRIVGQAYAKAADPQESTKKAIAALKAGEWKPGREKCEKEPKELVLALAEVTSKPTHVVDERLSSMRRKEKAALRKHPQVAVVLARMAADRAKEAAKAAKKQPAISLDF